LDINKKHIATIDPCDGKFYDKHILPIRFITTEPLKGIRINPIGFDTNIDIVMDTIIGQQPTISWGVDSFNRLYSNTIKFDVFVFNFRVFAKECFDPEIKIDYRILEDLPIKKIYSKELSTVYYFNDKYLMDGMFIPLDLTKLAVGDTVKIYKCNKLSNNNESIITQICNDNGNKYIVTDKMESISDEITLVPDDYRNQVRTYIRNNPEWNVVGKINIIGEYTVTYQMDIDTREY